MRIRPYLLLLTLIGVCPWQIHGKPTVIVSIPPQRAFVEAVAGDLVDVLVLVNPGQNPESFSITPKRLAQLSTARLYFAIGVPMETTLLPRIKSNYPQLKIVDTSAGIRKRTLDDHQHGLKPGAHHHTDDPHIWLSPGLAKIQLRHYLSALRELLPDHNDGLEVNFKSFLERLATVDTQLKNSLKDLGGATVFTYHPAFGYFLDRYGLRQETVELKGKQPSPRQLGLLIKLAQAHEAKVIFVQPQFDRHSAHALAKAINGRVETMDPLAENYLDNLVHMGEIIADSYR